MKIGFGRAPGSDRDRHDQGFHQSGHAAGRHLESEIEAIKPSLEVAHARRPPRYLLDGHLRRRRPQGCRHLGDQEKRRCDPERRQRKRRGRSASGLPQDRQPAGEEICVMLFRHRSSPAPAEPARRHADHHRLHDQRLRARHRGGRRAERLPPDGGARSRRRPLGGRTRAKPVRPQRQIRRRRLTRRDPPIPEDRSATI